MLTVNIPTDSIPPEVLEKISPALLKILILGNPTILLLIAVLVGTTLYDKVGLTVPAISELIGIEQAKIKFSEQLKFGVLFGLIAGVIIVLIGILFKSLIPEELKAMESKIEITTLARFGYGGITEELLMRFGFMTLMVWLIFKLTKNLNNLTYWLGLVLAALLFAIGHFPAVYSAVPNPSNALLIYILIGNSSAGLFFGWLFWKKGLEAAFIAHIFAHVAMIGGEQLFNV